MAERVYGYKQLRAWEKCDELAKGVYAATAAFPREEIYALTSQLRRAALSAPTNVVEGSARRSKKELSQFLYIAWASLSETEYLLEFALSQKYLTEQEFQRLSGLRDECSRLVWGLLSSKVDSVA